MIKVGERVKFISDTRVGVVCSIKKGIAQVEVDGFEIPVLVSDIVAVDAEEEAIAKQRIGPDEKVSQRSSVTPKPRKANSYGKISIDDDFEDEPIDIIALKRQFSQHQKSKTPDQDSPEPQITEPPYKQTDYNTLLMFVPSAAERLPEESDLDMYLVNDSSYSIFYSIGIWERGGYLTTISAGRMEEDSKIKIHHFKRTALSNVIKLQVSMLPYKPINYTPQTITQADIELHPLKFVRPHNYLENDYFDERSLSFVLTNTAK